MLNNIEAERARKGLNKEEISKMLSISPRTYYNWINEESDIPSSALIKLAMIFNVSIDYLLES